VMASRVMARSGFMMFSRHGLIGQCYIAVQED